MTTNDNIHPFEVIYDPDEQEYCIFAPEGCVLVNGVAVQIVDAEDGNVVLDLDPESLPDCLYAHVTEDSSATGGYKVEFDGESTKSGAKWNFRVVRFGVNENDGNQYDIATGIVNLGGGGETIPQPFDPNFEADDETGEIHLSAVGPGYAPWGRKLIDVAQPGSDSDVMSATSGRLGLKITHPVSASSLPTAEIIVASGRNTFPQSTDETTYLPLYDFDNGRITLDLRCYLALGVYE